MGPGQSYVAGAAHRTLHVSLDADARIDICAHPFAAVSNNVRHTHSRKHTGLHLHSLTGFLWLTLLQSHIGTQEQPNEAQVTVDDEAGHAAADPGVVGRAAVAVPDQAPRRARPLVLQLARAHDHRLNPEVARSECR